MIEYFKDCAGSPENERNDCTVRALAISTGKPYWDAYTVLQTFGRKPNKGTNIRKFFKNNKSGQGINACEIQDFPPPQLESHKH